MMVKSGASALGGADGHGNCGHMMFHFQFQAYRPTRAFAGEFPCNKAEWPICSSVLETLHSCRRAILHVLPILVLTHKVRLHVQAYM